MLKKHSSSESNIYGSTYQSVAYFLGSILILMLALFGIDTFLLSSLGNKRLVASWDWEKEDEILSANMLGRNLASGNFEDSTAGNWIWRSDALPVSEEATQKNRILVMGDSFVWGVGYSNVNDIWWRQLQKSLIESGYSEVEVIAAGLSGASTAQQLAQAQVLYEKYSPDLIIWGYVTNDPDEGLIDQFDYWTLLPKDPIIKGLESLASLNIFPHLTYQLNQAREAKLVSQLSGPENGYAYLDWELRLLEGNNIEAYSETLSELSNWMKSNDIRGFMMTLPNYPGEEHFISRHQRIEDIADSVDLPFYDVLGDFTNWAEQFATPGQAADIELQQTVTYTIGIQNNLNWGITPVDGHPGAVGTFFFAQQATAILEADYPDILGPKNEDQVNISTQVNDWVPHTMTMEMPSEGVFVFDYPVSEELMLRMPVGRPFVQLNLAHPVSVEQIQLSGNGLEEATLDVTHTHPDFDFDTGEVYTLPTQQGNELSWDLSQQASQKVNTIRVSASFDGSDRQLVLTVNN